MPSTLDVYDVLDSHICACVCAYCLVTNTYLDPSMVVLVFVYMWNDTGCIQRMVWFEVLQTKIYTLCAKCIIMPSQRFVIDQDFVLCCSRVDYCELMYLYCID
jgi:hypothetical protein